MKLKLAFFLNLSLLEKKKQQQQEGEVITDSVSLPRNGTETKLAKYLLMS